MFSNRVNDSVIDSRNRKSSAFLAAEPSPPKLFWLRGAKMAGFCFALMFAFITADAVAGPNVWISKALSRVGREDPPANTQKIALWAGRGEYESFQVIVRAPTGGLTNVRVAASPLTGDGKRNIPNTNVTLFREQYVHVTHGSPERGSTNRPLGPGWYADGLIPFSDGAKNAADKSSALTSFSVDAVSNQPVWVDIFVPRTAEPGAYRGTITVDSDQGAATVGVTLNVWNFELPLKPSLHTVFGIYNDASSSPKIFYADAKSNQRLLLEHKLMPVFVDPSDEREFIDVLGLNVSQLEFFKVASYGHCQQPQPPSVAELLAMKAKHQPDLSLYVHMGDEISECAGIVPAIREWSKNIRAAGLVAQLTAIPAAGLRDDGSGTGKSVADVWVMLPKQIVSNAADMNAAMKNGDQVWSYTALVQDSFSPKWAIDFEPINYRILGGFLNQVQGLSGLLYWCVNSWAINPTQDPWNNISYVENEKATPPGEGWLVYPGAKPGAENLVPSMRLKWIRKSVEDFEYIEILKRLGRGDWALGVARKVAPDWTNWTHDPSALETVRRQFGDEINRLMSTQRAPVVPARR